MIRKLSELPFYTIVVKDHNASEYYYDKIQPVWRSLGVKAHRFDATTPTTLPKSPLKFKKVRTRKYVELTGGVGKTFTETEKAVWYSHYRLWWKCAFENKRLVVLEHDCVPFDPSLLWFRESDHFKSFDQGAMGCYMIEPSFAQTLVDYYAKEAVSGGPLGGIIKVVVDEHRKQPHKWNFLESSTIGYKPACTQIIHSNYGTSIDHYKGTEAEGVAGIDKPWPYYIKIDNIENNLNIDTINKHLVKIQNKNLPVL